MANGAGGAEATAPATAADAPIHFSLEARRASALDSISTDALMALLQRVEKAHRESAERVLPEPVVEMGAGAGDGAGAKRQKHALQNDRMVSVMAALGLQLLDKDDNRRGGRAGHGYVKADYVRALMDHKQAIVTAAGGVQQAAAQKQQQSQQSST